MSKKDFIAGYMAGKKAMEKNAASWKKVDDGYYRVKLYDPEMYYELEKTMDGWKLACYNEYGNERTEDIFGAVPPIFDSPNDAVDWGNSNNFWRLYDLLPKFNGRVSSKAMRRRA